MYWADKIDNNFEIWKFVLQKTSPEQILECGEQYHNSIIWALALDRIDVQNHLSKMYTEEAITYAEKQEREELWVFTLKRVDVIEYFNKFSEKQSTTYVNKINLSEVRKFFTNKYYS